ncbi:hypothetical protein RhiirB3_431453 [Rhizophagus irregularis]|nr:hypothetical protein RhiirB3_431453 [Rhizophagus irregularis]
MNKNGNSCAVHAKTCPEIAENGNGQVKYSEEFTNFLVPLGNISPKALDLFCQNLEGRGIQSLRKIRNNSVDYLDPDLYFENVADFKQFT